MKIDPGRGRAAPHAGVGGAREVGPADLSAVVDAQRAPALPRPRRSQIDPRRARTTPKAGAVSGASPHMTPADLLPVADRVHVRIQRARGREVYPRGGRAGPEARRPHARDAGAPPLPAVVYRP